MKQPKKRFLNAQQIEDAIDTARRKADLMFLEAERKRKESLSQSWKASTLLKEAHRLDVKASGLINKKLPELSDKLAVMRTPVLIEGVDESLPT